MKVTIDNNVVEFKPGNAQETQDLEVLWRAMVDCIKYNKKLVPIGEYLPGQKNLARFVIE